MSVVGVVMLLVAGAWLGLSLATATGSRRRGAAPVLAAVAGLLFPLTWVAWYARDELPHRSERGSAT